MSESGIGNIMLYTSRAERSNTKECDRFESFALDTLDRLHRSVSAGDIVDVVGVLADIKPASLVSYSPELLSVVHELGLVSLICTYESEPAEDIAVSKNPSIARELASLASASHDSSDDIFRKMGELLGYPVSSTDYFIARRMTVDTDHELPIIVPDLIAGTIHREFCRPMLSPDSWHEEVKEFVLPLEEAVRRLAPETFSAIKEDVTSRKVAGNVMRLAGVQCVQLTEGDEQVA